MSIQISPDRIDEKLKALRTMVKDHHDIQEMLDLAADEADRRAAAGKRAVTLAWRVAGSSIVLALGAIAVAGGAVATSLRPTSPPEILVVEKGQGVVQPLISLNEYQMSPEESTIRRNLTTFVTARTRYSYENADDDYITAAAFMNPQMQREWADLWKDEKKSPLKLYGKNSKVRTKVGAISLTRNAEGAFVSARVGFTSRIVSPGQVDSEPTYWIATVPFHWVNQPTNERDRRINDLGMEITDFINDRDVDPAKPAAPRQAPDTRSAEAQGSPMALAVPADTGRVSP